jgi:HAD superfamily hydrolase (TIGR01509 family)
MAYYLFDFDGTLVDSMPTYVRSVLDLLDKKGIEYKEDIVKIITPLGFAGTARYFQEAYGFDMTLEDAVAQMHANAVYEYTYTIEAKKNVIETLRALRTRGDRLSVLTASPHETLDVCLKRLGIYDIFDNVWSCEDFGTTKADTRIYEMAAQGMGAAVGEVIFLDDNYNADATAKAAGMKVIGVYDDSSAEYEEQIRAITDAYIKDFSELIDLKI